MKNVERILVSHDGSAGAAHALDLACTLALQAGASVTVVHAYSPLEEVGKHDPPLELPQLRDEAQRRLAEEWCAPLADAGVSFDAQLVEDLPVAGIVRVADEVDADLIVAGTRGMGGVKGLVLGSVATELPRKSHRPVLIVPPPRDG